MVETALHGISTMHGNLVTDIRLAQQAGFSVLEIFYPKLVRYLENGGTINELRSRISDAGLRTGYVSALDHIERHEGQDRRNLLEEAKKISAEASALGADTVMVLPRNGVDHLPDEAIMDIMSRNIGDIADVGRDFGIRYMIELPAFTKYRTIRQAHETIRRLAVDNVGVVVDFWHFYASGATPDEVAAMDRKHIFGVHFCDGRVPAQGETWDETVLRSCMPGEGEVDLAAYAAAIKATGYDGPWSVELISPRLWETDPIELTRDLQNILRKHAT